jgi:glucose/arabinose dehydrogenase
MKSFYFAVGAAVSLATFFACDSLNTPNTTAPGGRAAAAATPSCQLVQSGYGPTGTVQVHLQSLVTGLEVPWGIAFLPGGDSLVTERPGRLRLVQNGKLTPDPVAQIDVAQGGEQGLLGIALSPQFSTNSTFFVYYTAPDGSMNQIASYKLSSDHTQATQDTVIFSGIAAGTIHNGGRLRFGPDGMLYASTGETSDATLPENPQSPNGKILRLNPDGSIPSSNPSPNEPWFIRGLRNTEAFDWLNPTTLVMADNGPTGEYEGRTGGDRVNIGQSGNNMGWPDTWHCDIAAGTVGPVLTWNDAVPPGGAAVYRGSAIPQWQGSVLIGSLGGEHLHRLELEQ